MEFGGGFVCIPNVDALNETFNMKPCDSFLSEMYGKTYFYKFLIGLDHEKWLLQTRMKPGGRRGGVEK